MIVENLRRLSVRRKGLSSLTFNVEHQGDHAFLRFDKRMLRMPHIERNILQNIFFIQKSQVSF